MRRAAGDPARLFMSVRLSNLGLGVEASESELPGRVAAALKIPESEILRWRILRKSLDARQRENLKFVYSVAVDLADGKHEVRRR